MFAISLVLLQLNLILSDDTMEIETDVTGAEQSAPRGLTITVENNYDFPVTVYYDNQAEGIFMVDTFI